jgi:hypothetical protein
LIELYDSRTTILASYLRIEERELETGGLT